MATNKVERAGVGFGIGQRNGAMVIEVRTHHDIIAALKGVQVDFELLNGTTEVQAKKILSVLNESIIGLSVTTKSDDKTEAAAG